MERQKTPLQADLPDKYLARSYIAVQTALSPAFELYQEIRRRVRYEDDECVVLDVGCGTGDAIEELARVLPHELDDRECIRSRIRAIGVDINPLPYLIRKSTFQKGQVQSAGLLSDIREDDMCELATVPSGSVDVLYCVGGLHYVADQLRALETGWRVLREPRVDEEGGQRPGGIMVYDGLFEFLTEPHVGDIISANADNANPFSLKVRMSQANDYLVESQLVIAEKTEDCEFVRFPWRHVGHEDILPRVTTPHLRHMKKGKYVR
ncbi:MAG: class I SAM-dependent methyltransferase [Patescibacteria group bacterium]